MDTSFFVVVFCYYLQAKCNFNCYDISGNTPLHLASGLGHYFITSVLLRVGADVYALNQKGESPLDHAKDHSRNDIIHMLEEAMKKRSRTDSEGEEKKGGRLGGGGGGRERGAEGDPIK